MPNHTRFLTLILRHRPETIGLALDSNGWVRVEDLLDAMKRHGRRMSRASLEDIVRSDANRRFTFSTDGVMIRAAQGHSIDINLGLAPAVPPPTLYHGTARHFLHEIFAGGLTAGRRKFVHLSDAAEAAREVGRRHGKPVVLAIDCARMSDEGYVFFQADNGVWLTASVPVRFIGFALK